MKLKFINAQSPMTAIRLVAKDIDITVATSDDYDVKVASKGVTGSYGSR